MNNKLSSALPGNSNHLTNIQAARKRIAEGKANLSCGLIDANGYADIKEIRAVSSKMEHADALRWHKNNPNTRFDDCGFPKDRKDRQFILSHDFGSQLVQILHTLKTGQWVYLHGNWGLGKTSVATRAIWELIKPHPAQKATYISINGWINDQMPEGEKHTPPLHKLVLLDDFDKFSVKSEFQVRAVLRLVEELKERNSLVLITSQFSVAELSAKNKNNIDFQVMLDRIRGKSVVWDKFTGGSKR